MSLKIMILGLGPQKLGYAFYALALCCFLVAALFIWQGVDRTLGVFALQNMHGAALSNNADIMRSEARKALSYLPDNRNARLFAVDWSADDVRTQTTRLRTQGPTHDQLLATVVTAIRAPEVIPDDDLPNGINGDLIKAGRALQDGKTAPTITFSSDDIPLRDSLAFWTQQHFRTTWSTQDPEQIRTAAGNMLLVMPGHPQSAYIRRIILALTPTTSSQVLNKRLSSAKGDKSGKQAVAVLRALCKLVPERAPDLALAIPSQERTATEDMHIIVGKQPVERLPKLLRQNTPQESIIDLVRHCLDLDRPDIARELCERLKEPTRKEWLIKIAERDGNLAELKALTEDDKYTPKAYQVHYHDGLLTFHISSAAGIAPTSSLSVMIGDQAVDAGNILRIGTLTQITIGDRKGQLRVMCDDTVLYERNVP